jgi:hypothetical protein
MIKLAILSAAALAIALPASADQRGRGGHDSKKPLIDLSATVKGLVDVDADILSKSRKGASILDLDAKIGGLKAGVDLDVSKRKGVDLDVEIGKLRSRGKGGHGGYDFGGGVGH